ncbi:hypothetical protein [Streptomyces chiangmaiensis]|uniref:Uncharacterized protein n=1 Tax=Streptomyces chiangmaiensis TaxID=766497 RepID=A0ABU7FUM7_9ACTN|nr:hypothetical protein [Streptomyces chiangmaiensis]MED7826809.1 hypothetical protein [Streptomyces chiangmaiensis]
MSQKNTPGPVGRARGQKDQRASGRLPLYRRPNRYGLSRAELRRELARCHQRGFQLSELHTVFWGAP